MIIYKSLVDFYIYGNGYMINKYLLDGLRLLIVFPLITRKMSLINNFLCISFGLFLWISSYEDYKNKNKISFILSLISSIILLLIGFNIL